MIRVKEILKEKGITQQEFADSLEITRSALSQQLSGKPSLTTIERMAEALKVPVWQLFISPKEAKGDENKTDFTALIQHKQDFYKADSLEELKDIVHKIESEEA